MKKLFYLIIALMLVPALVDCGATAAEQPSEPPVEATQSPAVVTDEPVVVNTPVPDTGIVALDAILDERAREFCFEEVRWFDIAFWKREDIMRKSLYGIQITLKSGSFESGDLVLNYSDPTPMDQKRYWQDNFSPKWYLSALPSDEINKGYGLVQNPGW